MTTTVEKMERHKHLRLSGKRDQKKAERRSAKDEIEAAIDEEEDIFREERQAEEDAQQDDWYLEDLYEAMNAHYMKYH